MYNLRAFNFASVSIAYGDVTGRCLAASVNLENPQFSIESLFFWKILKFLKWICVIYWKLSFPVVVVYFQNTKWVQQSKLENRQVQNEEILAVIFLFFRCAARQRGQNQAT